MRTVLSLLALLGVLYLAISGVGWGDYSYQWYKSLAVAAAGSTKVYFPPMDSTTYDTHLKMQPNHVWVTKSAGGSTDSLFVWSSSFAGGVVRVPMYAAAAIWQTWEFTNIRNGIDSLYIHSAASGTFHVIAKD